MLKEFLINTKAMLSVFVWGPTKKFLASGWNACFGPCCDNPKLTWTEGSGSMLIVSICDNCKSTRTYTQGNF